MFYLNLCYPQSGRKERRKVVEKKERKIPVKNMAGKLGMVGEKGRSGQREWGNG
jgi:hypothetical protein